MVVEACLEYQPQTMNEGLDPRSDAEQGGGECELESKKPNEIKI